MCDREEKTLEHVLHECPWTMDKIERKDVLKEDGSGIIHLKRIVRKKRSNRTIM